MFLVSFRPHIKVFRVGKLLKLCLSPPNWLRKVSYYFSNVLFDKNSLCSSLFLLKITCEKKISCDFESNSVSFCQMKRCYSTIKSQDSFLKHLDWFRIYFSNLPLTNLYVRPKWNKITCPKKTISGDFESNSVIFCQIKRCYHTIK